MQGFHADIDLHGQQVYLSFHMADLTASPQACCAPLLSKLPLLTVRTHKVKTQLQCNTCEDPWLDIYLSVA